MVKTRSEMTRSTLNAWFIYVMSKLSPRPGINLSLSCVCLCMGTLPRMSAPHCLLETLSFCLSFLPDIIYLEPAQVFWEDNSVGSLPRSMVQPLLQIKTPSLISFSAPHLPTQRPDLPSPRWAPSRRKFTQGEWKASKQRINPFSSTREATKNTL